ncbi:MAG: proton-conducting transporter membrane subunit [Methylococcaceae bacterium]|jgi:NADH:ubiquinone oxidoreductase subunit 5 (subunit L)/multisubunit Na+/H+ antiporter MnhA subunit
MDALVVLIPLLPLLAAIVIGIGHIFGWLKGEISEAATADIAKGTLLISSLLALALLTGDFLDKNTGYYSIGQWLSSDTLNIRINFISTGFNVVLASLFAVLLCVVSHFSVAYLHREAGYHRFFFILCLFASAMLQLVLSANAVGTFMGWELAGFCSYLLIGYAYNRPNASKNATRVFVTNRIGDAGFILGMGLTYAWTGNVNWAHLNAMASQLPSGQITSIGLCFCIAIFAKSAQIPFTPWLARAIEGPTPSSAIFYGAVMVHAGVYLLILLQPIFEQALLPLILIGVFGLLTAVYSFIVGLTQTDVKNSLIFAVTGQLGLMFLECSLGWWQLASWHLCAHASVRCLQILNAPALMHQVYNSPITPVSASVANNRWLYVAALQRFWLDPLADWALVRPIRRLAHDLAYFDDHVIDRLMGVPKPAINAISSLAQFEQLHNDQTASSLSPQFVRSSGIVGRITQQSASLIHWFENRMVLRGIGKDAIDYGRQLGHVANKIERLLLGPRYLVLFVFITLLVAF